MKSFSVLLPLILSASTGVLGGFSDSCTNIGFNPPGNLYATCSSKPGQPGYKVSVELSKCIENNSGRLRCPGAGYSSTCVDCVYLGSPTPTLACKCRNAGSVYVKTTIPIDACITYRGGILTCA